MFEEEMDRYWKTIVNTIRDGIMVVDTSGSILSVNQSPGNDHRLYSRGTHRSEMFHIELQHL